MFRVRFGVGLRSRMRLRFKSKLRVRFRVRSINVKLFYTCGAVIASNSDFSTEIIYSLWWESTPTQSCEGEETRIIPVRNQTGIDKSRNFTF